MIYGGTNFFESLQGAAPEMIAREGESFLYGAAALQRFAQGAALPRQQGCGPRPNISNAPDRRNGARMGEGKDLFSDGAQRRRHDQRGGARSRYKQTAEVQPSRTRASQCARHDALIIIAAHSLSSFEKSSSPRE